MLSSFEPLCDTKGRQQTLGERRIDVRGPALAELAERQHGVVSIRQLETTLGFSRNTVQRDVTAGRLHRLYRGVYAVGHRLVPPRGRCLAAVLACGPDALLSHGSAAWLWGISRYGPDPLAVTGPQPRRRRLPIQLHRSAILTDADRALVGAHSGHRAAAHAARLRRAIALYKPVPFTRSTFERRFFEAVLRAGLPRPATNFVEAGFELDFYWPEHRFAVELDTYATHGGHSSFERDRLRHEDLMFAGIEMIRVTDVRFHREPKAVLDRVASLLARRS